jgi:hypothetical protein
MRIEIKDIAGENCVSLEEGLKLYELIHTELARGAPVELDFAGCQVFASPFFNAAIGQLLRDVSPDDLNRQLGVANLSDAGHRLLTRVIRNSKEYYESESLRRASDDVMSQESDEAG